VGDATGALLGKLFARAGEKTAVVALGNPYVVTDFPGIQNYLCTFSNETVSELSAVKALFGEVPIRGHLPVSIPNVAQRGAGIERQARLAKGDPPYAQIKASQR
jgi:beta-N-acetylhexosaminidase